MKVNDLMRLLRVAPNVDIQMAIPMDDGQLLIYDIGRAIREYDLEHDDPNSSRVLLYPELTPEDDT